MSEESRRNFNSGGGFKPEKEGYNPFRSYAESKTFASENGLFVILPGKNELFIDYDSDAEKKAGLDLLRLFTRYYERRTPGEQIQVSWWRSKSGTGWHAKIVLPFELSPSERVGLQAIFGSDRAREVFSYLRLLRGEENATIFFETKADNPAKPADSETIEITRVPVVKGTPGQRQIEL